MSPVEPASSGSFEFRFRWKTFAQPLAIIGGFVPVDVGYGKFFFAFWDLSFRPVPWRPNAFCFDESCVVCVGCFILVDIESIDVDVIRRPVVHLVARHKITGIQKDRKCAAHPELTGGDQHHTVRRSRLGRCWQHGASRKKNGE